MEEDVDEWLAPLLGRLGLGDDACVQYVKDIVCMDSSVSSDQEKTECLTDFLQEATVQALCPAPRAALALFFKFFLPCGLKHFLNTRKKG